MYRFAYFAHIAFWIWMLVDCLRKDSEGKIWLWVVLFFQPFGAYIYFFARWLPNRNLSAPSFLRRWMRGGEIQRLEVAARQIGNAHQFIQLGDALRETGQYEWAEEAYAKALEKDTDDTQALWGASLVDIKMKDFESARSKLEKLLELDPQYKFGDVSLAYGKTLYQLEDNDAAKVHFEKHIIRWRHPEAIYLLATIVAMQDRPDEARSLLEGMLLDIHGSTKAHARRQGLWKRLAQQMLRKLPRGDRTGSHW